jgi:DNA-binding response OmpR family regulator
VKAGFGASFHVIFLSGERTESYERVAGLIIGADDYVVKPYAPTSYALVFAPSRRSRSRVPPEPLPRGEMEFGTVVSDTLSASQLAGGSG